jgi:hypothetical protein
MQRRILAALALALTVPAAAHAQTGQRYSVQGSGLFAALFGKAFEEINNGAGLELQFRVTPGQLSVGGGLQFTVHKPTEGAGEFFETIRLTGLFVEPRYVIDVGSARYAPYLSARLAISAMSFVIADGATQPDVELTIEEPTGPTINGGGGFLIRLGSRVNLDVGATFGYTKFDDITIRAENTTNGQEVTARVAIGSGTNMVLRAGLAIGLGG